MRAHSRVVFAISLFLLISFALAPPIGQAAEPEKKAAQAGSNFVTLMQKILEAWETMDPATPAPYYAKEAEHVFYDVAPLKYTGWAEYAEGAKKVLASFSSIKFTLGNDAQTHQHGSLAWGTATFRLDAATKDGTKEALHGRWTVLWEKRGRDWLIVHEHVSFPFGAAPEIPGQALHRRLGGYDAIAAVTDDFIGRLIADQQLSRFFTGASTDSKKRIRQLVVDQLCAATGGPCVYIGRSMKAAHEGLGITEGDWNAAVNHLVATLDKFQVPAKEKDELLGLASSLKGDIVAQGR